MGQSIRFDNKERAQDAVVSLPAPIRNPNAAADSERTANALFPAGFAFSKEYDDFSELSALAYKRNVEFMKRGPGLASGRLMGCHTSRLQLSHNLVESGFLYRGRAPDHTLTIGAHIGAPIKLLGEEITENGVALLPSNGYSEIVANERAQLFTAAIDVDLVSDLLPARLREQGKLNWSRGFRAEGKSELHAAVVGKITSTLTTCLEKPNLLKDGNYSATLERKFAEFAVSVFDTAKPETKGPDRLRLARKAIAFMHDTADEPISMQILCRVVGGSQRSLEMGFADLLGVTPKRYLTLLRLHRARRALLSGDAGNVTTVATANEFYHFGRFAEVYRHVYGETPVETLRKRTLHQYLPV